MMMMNKVQKLWGDFNSNKTFDTGIGLSAFTCEKNQGEIAKEWEVRGAKQKLTSMTNSNSKMDYSTWNLERINTNQIVKNSPCHTEKIATQKKWKTKNI